LEDRRFYMMKFRSWLYIIFGLLIFGFLLFIVTLQNEESEQIFPATINRDCAPWDGAAFTVSIPMHGGTIVNISIWQTPDIKLPVTFSFPDNTGQVGNASLAPRVGLPEQLTGSVYFQKVDQEHPVEGEFDLHTQAGRHIKGKFKAEWDDQVMLCG